MRISDWSSDVCSSDLSRPQSVALGRSLYARAHERREKLCRELSDRPADDRRRDRRGRRKPDGGLCARRPYPPYGRLARWRRDRARHDAEQAARRGAGGGHDAADLPAQYGPDRRHRVDRSEEHTSELQSLMRISYAVFCLKKKKNTNLTKYKLEE